MAGALAKIASKIADVGKDLVKGLLGAKQRIPKAHQATEPIDYEAVDSSTKVLGAIYKLMQRARKEELAQRIKNERDHKDKLDDEEERNQELIKALTVRRVPKKKAPPKKEEEPKKEEPKKPAEKPKEKPTEKPTEKTTKKTEETTKKTEETTKKQVDKESDKAQKQVDKEQSKAKKTAEKEQAAAKKKAEQEARKKETAEPVKPPEAKPPKTEPAAAPKGPTQKPSAGKIGAGVAAAGAFAGLALAERAQAASQGFKKLGLTNDTAIAGILSTAAKETEIGAAGTEAGSSAYKNTYERLEAGRGSIPESLKKKGVTQLGPGVGVQYMNLTFGKSWDKQKWEDAFSKGEDGFFEAVGYKGGSKYKGRGLIQVTHEAGYRHIGNLLGVDLLKNPELVADDRNINIAASLGYMGLSVGGFGFPNSDVSKAKLKEFYQRGLDRLNGVKDFNEALNISASNVFSGGRGLDYQKLSANESYKANLQKAQAKSGEVLDALSKDNKNMKDVAANAKKQETVNNTNVNQTNTQTNSPSNSPDYDDRSAYQKKKG